MINKFDGYLSEAVTVLPFGIIWKYESSFNQQFGAVPANLFLNTTSVVANLKELVFRHKKTDEPELVLYYDEKENLSKTTFPIFHGRLMLKINYGTDHTVTSSRLSILLPKPRSLDLIDANNNYPSKPLLIQKSTENLILEQLINLTSSNTKLQEYTDQFLKTAYMITLRECMYPEIIINSFGTVQMEWV